MNCPHRPSTVGETNYFECTCPKECPRHGKCCACVAHHREHGKLHPLFPDFIVVKKNGNGYQFEILEPHQPTLDDNLYKAKGMVRYSQRCTQLKRCEMIRIEETVSGDRFLRLNTAKMSVQNDVINATNENTLNTLFV